MTSASRIDIGEAELAHALKVGNPHRQRRGCHAANVVVGARDTVRPTPIERTARDGRDRRAGADIGAVTIDCDDCAVRGPGCKDCVVSVLLGVPETLLDDERAALEVLAEAGLAPRLRLVPIHRHGDPGRRLTTRR